MAFGDLTNKLEAAALALLAANPIPGLQGFAGQTSATHSRPCLIAKVEQGDETPKATGNFNMQLMLQVQSSADDTTLETHRNFFGGIVDLFTGATGPADLSAAIPDFHAFDIFHPRFSESVEERAFISELTLTVYCCASAIG